MENLRSRRQSNFSTARIRPEDALLDQIQEAQALTAVVLRDRHDQAQVRLDHAALGQHVAGLDALGELDLLDLGQQRIAADLGQEALERVGRAVGHRQNDGTSLLDAVLVAHLNAHAVELAGSLLDGHRLVAGLCECLVDLGERHVATLKPTLDEPLQFGRKCGVLSGDHGVFSTPRRLRRLSLCASPVPWERIRPLQVTRVEERGSRRLYSPGRPVPNLLNPKQRAPPLSRGRGSGRVKVGRPGIKMQSRLPGKTAESAGVSYLIRGGSVRVR